MVLGRTRVSRICAGHTAHADGWRAGARAIDSRAGERRRALGGVSAARGGKERRRRSRRQQDAHLVEKRERVVS